VLFWSYKGLRTFTQRKALSIVDAGAMVVGAFQCKLNLPPSPRDSPWIQRHTALSARGRFDNPSKNICRKLSTKVDRLRYKIWRFIIVNGLINSSVFIMQV